MTTQTTSTFSVYNTPPSYTNEVVPYEGGGGLTNSAPPTMDDFSYFYTSPSSDEASPRAIQPYNPSSSSLSSSTTTSAAAMDATTSAMNVQKQQASMKKSRKRIQAAAAVTGAVSGFVVAGPLGSILLGCTSHLVTKTVCKKRERKILDKKYDQAIAQGQVQQPAFSDDAVFT